RRWCSNRRLATDAPHLAAALGEAVVVRGEFLVGDDPEALAEKEDQEERGQPLRPSDAKPGTFHAAGCSERISFGGLNNLGVFHHSAVLGELALRDGFGVFDSSLSSGKGSKFECIVKLRGQWIH